MQFLKSLFRHTGIKTIFSLGLLLFFIIATFTVVAIRSQRDNHLIQIQAAHQQARQLQNKLASLPAPEKILPGERDSVLRTLINEAYALEADTQSSPELPGRWKIAVHNGNYIADTDSSHALDEAYRAVNDNMQHHKAVLEALTPILEYNPQADLMDPSLDSSAITQRLTEAQEGLDSIHSQLLKLSHPNDENLGELLPLINSLKQSAEETNSSNKQQWYDSVRTTQEKIITNRQTYWQTILPQLLSNLISANRSLSETEFFLR
jgi:hypothetical protein